MKYLTLALALTLTCAVWGQTETEEPKQVGYEFTVVKENPITSIKNQGSSGTCWSFSGVGFLESELIRTGKGEHDLSEMYIVRRNYEDKAQKYVRLSGSLNFAQGGSFADVIETLDEYGVLPDSEMTGFTYGETRHIHSEMEAVLNGYVKAVIENRNKRLSSAWFNGFKGILDAYLGTIPQNFTYNGKNLTPQGLVKDLGLTSDNYISVTSFTHHPFYTQFPIEVPDNWRWANSYNVPMDDMIKIIDNAIEKGYTIAWATDVSENGFTRNGIAVVPDEKSEDVIGSDQAHWLGLSAMERNSTIKRKADRGPLKELDITQEMRQRSYDNYETTDDHGMQIYGIAKDQNGKKYYMVKNSWGETGKYKGIWYASEAFVKYKTISFVINKNSLPKDIANKLNL
ncbi:aminopeptidase C [Dysgonomonas sp. 520]|uniref:aminopeptidase C n=1 Tax=Dysgonomonas sp. 520 TaxID=2302931 RepID=UPI0013D287B9|nr:C1 family peptidase [Dysgonomonas sp. 520]NDW08628.1 aminopeptidase [Dysgonomonas sp. 520]